jgi:HSP20 family protein
MAQNQGIEQGTERERPIVKGRDNRQEGALSRRPSSSPIFGFGGSPYSLMRRMVDDMDRLFENFATGRGAWAPQLEVLRRDDKLVVRADLPGLRKDDVSINIENDTLTISGERRDEHEEDQDGYYRTERSYGQFYRAIPLPEGVNADQAEATFKDGVLEVTLPAPRETKEKRKQVTIR